MLELSLRPYADGCDSSPVPFIEGWYVAPEARRAGHRRRAGARRPSNGRIAEGYTEMASDALLENTDQRTRPRGARLRRGRARDPVPEGTEALTGANLCNGWPHCSVRSRLFCTIATTISGTTTPITATDIKSQPSWL